MYALVDDGVPTYFVWDKNGMNLLVERDASGNVIADYTHGYAAIDGSGSLEAARKHASGVTYYQYRCGTATTTRALLDQDGNVTAQYRWNAWGRLLSGSDPAPATASDGRRIGSAERGNL